MATHQEIYEGFWINRLDGPVSGSTLTLSRDSGAYLIAFIALFVHVSGASFWRLVSFAIFYYRAHPDLQDQTILQQQAVYRNSTSAISALRGFGKVVLRSRNWRTTVPAIAWAALNFVAFLAAGIFSSRVTSTRSDVLLKPTHCGEWVYSDIVHGNRSDFIVDESVLIATQQQLHATSHNYASVCYGSDSASDGCLTFGRRPPNWDTTMYSGCPFGDLCLDNLTFSVDSGYVTSDLDLGINSSPKDRMSLRKRVECAPLKQKEFMQVYSGDDVVSLFPKHNLWGSPMDEAKGVFGEAPGLFEFEAFFYGPTASLTSSQWKESAATYIFNKGTWAYSLDWEGKMPIVDLQTMSIELFPNGSLQANSAFHPMPQLMVPAKQVTLLFLSTNAWYSEIVTDPWFRTDKPFSENFTIRNGPSTDYTLYMRNPATTLLGCTEMYEICNAGSDTNGECLVINSKGEPYRDGTVAELLKLNERQIQIERRLRAAGGLANLASVVISLGGKGLLAYEFVSSAFNAPLPNNQWTLEVENWFTTMLTVLQLYTTQFVTGMQNQRFNKYLRPPTKEQEWMCHNQIIQRKDYASFSVLGLGVTLFVGGFIVGLNACIDQFVRIMLRRTTMNQFRQTSWDENELLELHAMATTANAKEATSPECSHVEPKACHLVTSEPLNLGRRCVKRNRKGELV